MKESFCAEARIKVTDAESRIAGLRSSNPELVIQLVTLEKIPRAKTVRMIAAQTIRAMETASLLASKPEMDLLLRLAGTRQISAAMEKCGYKAPGKKLLVALGPTEPLERLREAIAREKDYTQVEGTEVDEEGFRMVEAAALLGTRT